MLKRKKGQSTLEYIILVTAAVAVVILFLKPGGKFSQTITDSYSQVTDGANSAAKQLASAIGSGGLGNGSASSKIPSNAIGNGGLH